MTGIVVVVVVVMSLLDVGLLVDWNEMEWNGIDCGTVL